LTPGRFQIAVVLAVGKHAEHPRDESRKQDPQEADEPQEADDGGVAAGHEVVEAVAESGADAGLFHVSPLWTEQCVSLRIAASGPAGPLVPPRGPTRADRLAA